MGTTLNSTLNSASFSSVTYYIPYSLAGESSFVNVYTYSGEKYCPITASQTMTISLSSANFTFTKGAKYWFKVEPIKWRVSNYNESSTAYPDNWKNYGQTKTDVLISDKALGYSARTTSSGFKEGFETSNGDILDSFWYYLDVDSSGTTFFGQSAVKETIKNNASYSYSFEYYGASGQQTVVKTTKTTKSYYVVPSESELSRWFGDKRAKPTHFLAFQMGVSDSQYVDYWTRDLGTNLLNGKAIGKDGYACNRWATNPLGYRFAIYVSGTQRV